jgi:hypothetical protein
MIRLSFEPPQQDADWSDWLEKAAAEVTRMLQDGANRKIDSVLYKRPRQRLLEVTHDKCAYCELPLAAGQRAGDVEHYRPKGSVRDRHGKLVKVQLADGTEVRHPGYYWLAYDYRNLLPACAACNRRATDRASGGLTGKSDIFPTLDDHWAAGPEEVVSEKPALLNPWVDDPTAHLMFDPETGLVVGITERGKTTERVLGLNRDGLPEERRRAAEDIRRIFADAAGDTVRRQISADDARRLASVLDGSAAYSAICREEVRRNRQKMKSWLESLGQHD